MKKTLIILFILVFNYTYKAQQNLVTNGDFEQYSACPTTLDQLNLATGWSSYSETPDYFNACSSVAGMATPNVAFGYQVPYGGNAYVGFIPYDISGTDYREIIGTQLISPLSIGNTYYFSFFLSFAGTPNYTSLACNKIGIRFSTVSYSFTNPIPIDNFSHYYITAIINDTLNWVQVKGSYVADSSYNYLAIGNFFNDANMLPSDTLGMANSNNYESYYYIDNVALSTDSTVAYATGVNQYDNPQIITVFPNPCNNLLHIRYNDIPKQVEVYDIFGNLHLKANYFLRDSEYMLDVSSLSNGLYIMKINIQNLIIQKQIVISKQQP